MADIHDYGSIDLNTGANLAPYLLTATDDSRNLRYRSADGLLEPTDHTISAWCKGDGTTTSFTIGKIPANVLVREVSVVVSGTSGTSTTTIAVGYSGTTGAYMAASAFTNSMNAAGVKTVTTVPVHETTARTVLATFNVAWDSGAKALVSVRYQKLPAVPA